MYQQLHDPAFLAVASGGTPALDLFFSATKALDSRITFSRGSSATFINSSGLVETAASGVARFTHNPSTLASLGLLIEESRTNTALRSQEIATSPWTANAGILSATNNFATAPDGTTTATRIIENTTTNTHTQFQTVLFTTGVTYTLSVFAKALTRSVLQLLVGSSGSTEFCNFDLSAGTANRASGRIERFPNGWFRCSLTFTSATTAGVAIALQIQNDYAAARDASYLGNGTGDLLLWGAQLEAGAFATSYIPTTSATVTRAADVATMTGTNFSSWYRQDEGTLLAEGLAVSGQSDVYIWGVSLGADASDSSYLRLRNTTSLFTRRQSGQATGDASVQAYSFGNAFKMAGAYRRGDVAACLNSGAVGTSTSNNSFSATQSEIGRLIAGGAANTTLSRLRYWPRRLPNANLQTLTT